MPIQGYTPNKNLAKIAQNSTDNWDVWSNQNLDTLDEPTLIYNIAAAENLNAGDVAVIKDDGTGAKKAYLALPAAYSAGDPLGITLASATAGSSVRLSLEGRVQNTGWSFGPSHKFVYLSNTGAVTTTPTATKIGFVLSATAIYFTLQAPPGGQTDTVSGANGIQNTGDNVNAVLSPVYGSTANTVCQGNDSRLHAQNTDGGTSASSFEINYTANSARLLTTGLTANRDYTLPDGTTKLVGESVPAAITAQHSFSPAAPQAPFTLGANAQGQLVTGLNADKLDGSDSSAFATSGHNHDATYAPIAKGVTNGDFHDHAGGDGAQISLASGVTGALPVGNGGTGQTSGGSAGNALLSSGSVMVWGDRLHENFISNGTGEVAQRAALDLTTLGSGVYGFGKCDRFAGAWSGTACSAGSLTQYTALGNPPSRTGFAHHFSGVTLTGTGVLYHRTRIESLNARKLKNQNCTLSVRVYQVLGASATFTLYVRKANSADNFSAVTDIGASGGTVVGNTSSAHIKYENFSIGDVSNGIEIELKIESGAITNGNLYITQYQLEVSPIATDFKFEPFQQALAKCQRYYWKTFPYATAPAQNAGTIGPHGFPATRAGASTNYSPSVRFPVQMRTSPTLTFYNPSAANAFVRDGAAGVDCGSPTAIYNSADGFTLYCTGAASTAVGNQLLIHVTADAEL